VQHPAETRAKANAASGQQTPNLIAEQAANGGAGAEALIKHELWPALDGKAILLSRNGRSADP